MIYYFIRHKPFWKSTGGGDVEREESSDCSFWLILPGFLATFFAPPLEWMYLPGPLPRSPGMQIAGLGLILTAVAMCIWVRAHIRGLCSGHLEMQTDHRLWAIPQ